MIAERAVAILALIGIVYVTGLHIPLPGIDTQILSAVSRSGGEAALRRMSIFALGVLPLYTALAIGEIGRLIFTGPKISPEEDSRYAFLKTVAVLAIALAITGLQAYGIASGLRSAGIVRQDAAGFEIVIVATFLGATVLLFFFTGLVRIHGLRNGFWALWCIPILLDLPRSFAASVELTRTGAASLLSWLVALGYLGLSIAAIVLATSLWRAAWQESRAETENAVSCEPREILIWPVVLSAMLPGVLLTLIAFGAPGIIQAIEPYLRIIAVMVASLLIPLFVFGYVRLASPQGRLAPRLVAAGGIIAVIQIAIVVAGSIVTTNIPLPIGLGSVAVIGVTVAFLGLRSRPA